jgi:hypothetical protein
VVNVTNLCGPILGFLDRVLYYIIVLYYFYYYYIAISTQMLQIALFCTLCVCVFLSLVLAL